MVVACAGMWLVGAASILGLYSIWPAMDSGDQVAATRLVSFLPTLLEWPDYYRIIRIIDVGTHL